MTSKRDLQLIRLACRRRWLTSEQGEECLFLKRQFGDKRSIEQILRERQYLGETEIAELNALLQQAARRPPSQMSPIPSEEPQDAPSSLRQPPPPTVTESEASLTLWNEAVGPSSTVHDLDFSTEGLEDPALFAPPLDTRSGPKTVKSPPLAADLMDPTLMPTVQRPPSASPVASNLGDSVLAGEETIERPLIDDEIIERRSAVSAASDRPAPADVGSDTIEQPLPIPPRRPLIGADVAERRVLPPLVPDKHNEPTVIAPLPGIPKEPKATRVPKSSRVPPSLQKSKASPRAASSPSTVPAPSTLSKPPVPAPSTLSKPPVPAPSTLPKSSPVPAPSTLPKPSAVPPSLPKPQSSAALDSSPASASAPPPLSSRGRPSSERPELAPPVRVEDETILDLPASSILGPASSPHREVGVEDVGESAPEQRAEALAHEVGLLTGIHPVPKVGVDPSSSPAVLPTVEVPSFDPDGAQERGQFGAYDVHYVVARGERSTIYRATHIHSHRDVALKILKATGRDGAEFVSERSEALIAAAKLDDPRVIRVLDVGQVANRYYVALEHGPGWPLQDKLTKGPLDLADVLRIGTDVAAALSAAEAHGVVHGDLRPDHVIVDDEGRARLGGFGLRRVYEGRPGTPGFMAPEVAAGEAPTGTSDQFGLGALLFLLTTGRPAFNAVSDEERLRLSQHTEPPDPRLFEPEVPESVARLILRLMARAPADRFERVHFAKDALDAERKNWAHRDEDADTAEVPMQPVLARALVGTLLLVLTALGIPLLLDLAGWASLREGLLARPVALASATTLWFAAATQMIVALIRRGEILLPSSSGRLVQVQELSGLAGATLLVAGFAVAPPAIVNLGLAVGGVILLGSGMFGALLRSAVSAARGDGGVGRVLAVLGDARLVRWRRAHVPGLTTLASVALVRWMALAYFAAS